MQWKDAIYRAWSFVWHMLSAWNTTGEGIHSPNLFYIVRLLLRDENNYYCFADIERRREILLSDTRVLNVTDYGSQGSPEGRLVQRRVCDIARTHLESPRVGQVLFRLLVHMRHGQDRPLELIELGTSLGITTAYMASAHSGNHVLTFEGSRAVAQMACRQWRALRLENIQCVEGRIEDTLFKHARAEIDMAFVDANHTFEATMRYADWLLPQLAERGVLIIDDIHYSREMAQAWTQLKADPRVTTSMDLYHIGLLFVDPHYLKRHYKIRI